MSVFLFVVHEAFLNVHDCGISVSVSGPYVREDGTDFDIDLDGCHPNANWTWEYRLDEMEYALDQIRIVHDAFSKNLKVFVKCGDGIWGIYYLEAEVKAEDTEDTYW